MHPIAESYVVSDLESIAAEVVPLLVQLVWWVGLAVVVLVAAVGAVALVSLIRRIRTHDAQPAELPGGPDWNAARTVGRLSTRTIRLDRIADPARLHRAFGLGLPRRQ